MLYKSNGDIQLNLSTTATLGTEESSHCKKVAVVEEALNKSQCMNFLLSIGTKKGCCREVAISGGLTVITCSIRKHIIP